MRNQEAGLGSNGDLQRGSNIGRGQVAAADFFIIPDIANSNRNSGGNDIGAAVWAACCPAASAPWPAACGSRSPRPTP